MSVSAYTRTPQDGPVDRDWLHHPDRTIREGIGAQFGPGPDDVTGVHLLAPSGSLTLFLILTPHGVAATSMTTTRMWSAWRHHHDLGREAVLYESVRNVTGAPTVLGLVNRFAENLEMTRALDAHEGDTPSGRLLGTAAETLAAGISVLGFWWETERAAGLDVASARMLLAFQPHPLVEEFARLVLPPVTVPAKSSAR